MRPFDLWRDFHGPNAGYVLELYERYQHDPAAVDAETRALFDRWSPDESAPAGAAARTGAAAPAGAPDVTTSMAVVHLAAAIRGYGHLAARLDPLGGLPPGDPALELRTHGLTPADLRRLPASLVGGAASEGRADAYEALVALRQVYCQTIGYDYDHVRAPAEREWLRDRAESRQFHPQNQALDEIGLLERLTEVEVFEHFLQRVFPGKTRFSIEGLDTLVPLLDEILAQAAAAGISHIFLGMAHRGRLNVLAHVLQKPYDQILAEFKDPVQVKNYHVRAALGWMGDVKYHEGARLSLRESQGAGMSVHLVPNPSHLEHINPVVAGMTRAADTQVDAPGEPRFDHVRAMALIIHGDAAFPAQGVVSETLNFANISGYRIGGTLHIIANNQLGFTTPGRSGRSTIYASDLAKGFKIPVVHVNADDPEACIEVARLAFAYRAKFNKDFLIDLIGYRRHGHNEGDEPRFTQPLMYRLIDDHATARQLWAETLVQRERLTTEAAADLVETHMARLTRIYESLQPEDALPPSAIEAPPPPGAARRVQTSLPGATLQALNEALLEVPERFTVDRKLERIWRRRSTALADPDAAGVDWGQAESLALASILAAGIGVRLTGEDVERGTFSHRHAVLYDSATGDRYIPLQHLPQARAAFEVRNSPLSELAAVAFEYGYNIQAPDRLVLWEAQYGDFINVAQVMIDEFVVSGRAKWEQTPSLVLLLPHGHEGQGPDHSTGRLERFLQLAAETNIRVANPSTAAQFFHLLRRQALLLRTDPLPLVVMTPKSLLRHPAAMSSLNDLATGGWHPVLDDPAADAPDQVRRLVLSSGKVGVELANHEARRGRPDLALLRLEQLYPFPAAAMTETLARYPKATELIWVQEEPANMGAWDTIGPQLRALAGVPTVRYVGRPRGASPAEGSSARHQANQARLLAAALASGLVGEAGQETDARKTLTAIQVGSDPGSSKGQHGAGVEDNGD